MSERINKSSEKGFGIVFSIFFFILSIYLFFYNIDISLIFAFIGIIFLLISIIKPIIFKYPNYFWHKLSIILNKITSPIIMFFIYSVSILPIGVILKIIGKDSTIKKIDPKEKSYWITRTDKNSSMKDQF